MARELTRSGKYLLFWRQWPSNWEPSPFTFLGRRYSCVEQWMMHEKAELFGDGATADLIMAAQHPREHQRLGRLVAPYDEAKWAAVRLSVVVLGTLEKYRQNPGLLELLLATSDDELFVEASPHDRVWGIGMAEGDPDAGDPSKWRGQNLLGKAVTAARVILRAEKSGG